MKALVRVVCATFLFSAFALAQNPTPDGVHLNSISAGADGKFEAQPDTAIIRMDVAAQQDTSSEAYEHASIAAQKVRDVLKANGIDAKVAQVSMYQTQPVYDWKNPKHKVIGYRTTTSITLKLRDFSKIGPITQQLADIDDMQNQSVNYTLEDIEQAKAKASEDAFKKARNQAAAVASAGGRNLGDLLYASVDVNQQVIMPYVQMRAMSKTASATATPAPTEEFTPQTVTINAHVNCLFALK